MSKKIVPINRISKFFSEEDFKFQIELGRESVEDFGNFSVVLYKIDRKKTNPDLYGEVGKKEIIFKPPIELKVVPELTEPQNKVYNKDSGSLRFLEDGQFKFSLFQEQLNELDTDIDYGDYIGYQVDETRMIYFSVVNDGKKNYNNEQTIMGYKGAYRTIVSAPVDEDEFSAK